MPDNHNNHVILVTTENKNDSTKIGHTAIHVTAGVKRKLSSEDNNKSIRQNDSTMEETYPNISLKHDTLIVKGTSSNSTAASTTNFDAKKSSHNDDGEDTVVVVVKTNSSKKKATNLSCLLHDIKNMDATEYMQYVSREAKELPSIFVAPTEKSLECNRVRSSSSFTYTRDNKIVRKMEQEDAYHDCSNNDKHKHSHKKHMKTDDDNMIITGCAGSAQYLISHRTVVLPPPTIHHLPQGKSVHEWVNETIANFVELRTAIETQRIDKQQQNNQHQQQQQQLDRVDILPQISVTKSADCTTTDMPMSMSTTTTTTITETVLYDNNNTFQREKHQPRRFQMVPPLKDRMAWFRFFMGDSKCDIKNNKNNHRESIQNVDLGSSQQMCNNNHDVQNEKHPENHSISIEMKNNLPHDGHDNVSDENKNDKSHNDTNSVTEDFNDDDDDDDNADDDITFMLKLKKETKGSRVLTATASLVDPSFAFVNIDKTNSWDHDLPPNGYMPTVALLLQMDQIMIRRLLQHLSYYLTFQYKLKNNIDNNYNQDNVSSSSSSSSSPSIIETATKNQNQQPQTPQPLPQQQQQPVDNHHQLFLWIYALLVRLEVPIHRDDCVTLFSILKRLTILRSSIPVASLIGNDQSLPPKPQPQTQFERDRSDKNCSTSSSAYSNTHETIGHNKIDETTIEQIHVASGVDTTAANRRNLADHHHHHQQQLRELLAEWNVLIVIIGIYLEQGGGYKTLMEVEATTALSTGI